MLTCISICRASFKDSREEASQERDNDAQLQPARDNNKTVERARACLRSTHISLPTLSHLSASTTNKQTLSTFHTMPSIIAIINSFSASSLLAQIPLLSSSDGPPSSISNSYSAFGNAPSCPVDSPTSCQNSTVAPDSCCFIYPGGQLLQTQFWDTNPTVGPDDSWTLHGLWFVPLFLLRCPCSSSPPYICSTSEHNTEIFSTRPDLCDGTYPTYCKSTPQTHSITSLLTKRAPELLEYMPKQHCSSR